MKDWYLRQTPRDRMVVMAVALLSLVGLVYLFVWDPLVSGIDDNRTVLNARKTSLQRVEVGAAQIAALGTGGGTQLRESNKAPYQIIDEVIRGAGLTQPERVEPSGADGARVQFSEVPFDQLVLVLAELELYGLNVKTMNITRKNAGTVSARFNMEKG